MLEFNREEAVRFIEENDVKFIRLAFCDLFGRQKNVSVMPGELGRAFEEGVSFDASAVRGFLSVQESDLFLRPDPATLSVLPWRPAQGRVVRFFCGVFRPDGAPFEGDTRAILRRSVTRAGKMGLSCRIGSECEFYLLRLNEEGEPALTPHDHAGYCDISPLDRGENVRREICLTLEEMGLRPESSHHEQGPGQNEIDFRHADAMCAADQLVAFESVVKAIAAQNGLYASFLPKPFPGESGSGLHANLSLSRGGKNLFEMENGRMSPEAESFLEGILCRAAEITAFSNPLPQSYARLGSREAPGYVAWGQGNRSQLVRVPAAKGAACRMEVRLPDPACNPYLVFALLLEAGLEGIEKGRKLRQACGMDLYRADPEELRRLEPLPRSLGEALDAAEKSDFIRRALPGPTVEKYLSEKRREWERYQASPDKDAYLHENELLCY